MTIKKKLLSFVLVLAVALTATASDSPKFRPASAVEPAVGQYLVTLSELASLGDLAATASRMAAEYGGRLEPYAEEGFRGFLVMMRPAAARRLSEDARVSVVQEIAPARESSPPQAPTRFAAAAHSSTEPVPNETPVIGAYTYDDSGNIISIVGLNGAETFDYDPFGRVVKGTYGSLSQEYTYDRYGNIKTIKTPGRPERRLGVNSLTNRIDQRTYPGNPVANNVIGAYDPAGNQTSLERPEIAAGATFTYDGLNVLTQSTIANSTRRYIYTASEERLATFDLGNGSEKWTVRDLGGQVLRQLKRVGNTGPLQWDEDYLYRGSQMLAAYVAGPEKILHFYPDHLGTPRLMTGNGGAKVSEHRYFPFGEEITDPNQDAESKKFTGHERDSIPGAPGAEIDYMHARYYGVGEGRFLSVDPTWESADLTRPQTWNRYSYVTNNPIGLADPDGRNPFGWLAKFLAEEAAHQALIEAEFLAGQVSSDYMRQRQPGSTYARPQSVPRALTDPRAALIARNQAQGRYFENAVLGALRVAKNNTKVEGSHSRGQGRSIPDVMVEGGGLIEIKSSKYLSLDRQLQIQYSAALKKGVSLNLVVSPETEAISVQLQNAITITGGKIVVYDPKTNQFRDWGRKLQ